ncbi:MAG: site-specific integrase [Acidimicrobiales bacterium]|jgi:integrase|nr:site-specific integrase [Acidimicrobiales bacterium]
MSRRRGRGEGSFYFDNTKELWVGVVDLPPDGTGRRRRKYVRAKRKQDVVAKVTAIKTDLAKGQPLRDERRTTTDYLRWWYREVLPGSVKDSTAQDYVWVLEKYVIPAIGGHRLVKLTPDHVHAMLRDMEQRGLSPRTRRLTRTILRRALTTAERFGHVTRNVASLTEPPKVGSTKLDDSLTLEQAKAVLDTVQDDRFAALAEIVLALGLRKGEVLALRWQDVDFEHSTITVSGTMKSRKGGGWYVDLPKTKKSERVLPLVDRVRRALTERAHIQVAERERAGADWQEHGFVFTTRNGTPINEWNAYRWWRRLTEKAGIGPRRFHASRHTTATLLHEQGVPLEVISALLGHSSLAITADIYTDIGLKAKREAAERIGAALE